MTRTVEDGEPPSKTNESGPNQEEPSADALRGLTVPPDPMDVEVEDGQDCDNQKAGNNTGLFGKT